MILAASDPGSVLGIRIQSEATCGKIVQNLARAAGFHVIAIPIAAGALGPVGITLPPAVGARLISVSTIVGALNARLLRTVNLRPNV